MRLKLVFIFFLSMMMGCATLTKVDPQSGLQVNYTGPARGAADLVRATDSHLYALAEKAMKKGMPTTLHHEGTRFTAGMFSGEYGSLVGGYAAPTVSYGTHGFIQSRFGGLPPLQIPTQSSVQADTSSSSNPIVECPNNRAPSTVAEQAACAMMIGETLVQEREPR